MVPQRSVNKIRSLQWSNANKNSCVEIKAIKFQTQNDFFLMLRSIPTQVSAHSFFRLNELVLLCVCRFFCKSMIYVLYYICVFVYLTKELDKTRINKIQNGTQTRNVIWFTFWYSFHCQISNAQCENVRRNVVVQKKQNHHQNYLHWRDLCLTDEWKHPKTS